MIKEYATMALYNRKEQLYLEADATYVGLDTSLQVRDRVQLPRNETTNTVLLSQ